tara:strand:+ start:874 stop:1650 length:777 start_codon:yes stop_codon:yes gene_type:complete
VNKLQILELLEKHHPHLSSRQAEMYLELSANNIVNATGVHKRTDIFSSIAGQRWYNFPLNAIDIEKVWFNDVEIPRLIGEPVIDDDEFGEDSEDTADTALSTPTANANNKRFWIHSNYKTYTEATVGTAEEAAERVRNRIGIVEKVNNAVTRDGRTSNYQSCSVTGTYNIRVAGSWLPSPFLATDDATSSYAGPLTAIPQQYHDVLLNGAISRGYQDPESINPDMLSFFDGQFQEGIKKIKKYTRTRTGTGFIKPQDF